jgi:4'-phosphopantetheinyl transferase EntD
MHATLNNIEFRDLGIDIEERKNKKRAAEILFFMQKRDYATLESRYVAFKSAVVMHKRVAFLLLRH